MVIICSFVDIFVEVFAEVELADFLHVVLDHDADEGLEGGLLWVPAEEGLGLGGVAQELFDLGGTEVLGVDLDEGVPLEGGER